MCHWKILSDDKKEEPQRVRRARSEVTFLQVVNRHSGRNISLLPCSLTHLLPPAIPPKVIQHPPAGQGSSPASCPRHQETLDTRGSPTAYYLSTYLCDTFKVRSCHSFTYNTKIEMNGFSSVNTENILIYICSFAH